MNKQEKSFIKNHVLFFIFLTLMIYLSVSFVLAELNPFAWSMLSRIIMIIMLFIFNFPFFINYRLKN